MEFKSEIVESDLEELLRPKLRLFLSVDVVGSTEFKQKSDTGPWDWLTFFVSFFNEFRGDLELEIRAAADVAGRINDVPRLVPQLWKSLGDELIFVAALGHQSDVPLILRAFMRAVKGRSKRTELPLKGAAWIAGFPVGNVEVPLEGYEVQGVASDYIGPQIDIGFRLSKFASPSKMVISVDLALLLEKQGGLDLFFDGRQVLKGVLSGKRYPIIWIRDESEEDQDSDCGKLLRPPSDKPSVFRVCREFIEEHGFPMMEPFILGPNETIEDIGYPEYGDQFSKITKLLRKTLVVTIPGTDESVQTLDEESDSMLEEIGKHLKAAFINGIEPSSENDV